LKGADVAAERRFAHNASTLTHRACDLRCCRFPGRWRRRDCQRGIRFVDHDAGQHHAIDQHTLNYDAVDLDTVGVTQSFSEREMTQTRRTVRRSTARTET
jgi:hypothetical protein